MNFGHNLNLSKHQSKNQIVIMGSAKPGINGHKLYIHALLFFSMPFLFQALHFFNLLLFLAYFGLFIIDFNIKTYRKKKQLKQTIHLYTFIYM